MLGPRLGSRLPAVKAALDAGDYEELEGGGVRVAGEELGADEVLHGEGAAVEGFAIAQNGALSVALDTTLDEELIREGRVRELDPSPQRDAPRRGPRADATASSSRSAPTRRISLEHEDVDQGRDARRSRCARATRWRFRKPESLLNRVKPAAPGGRSRRASP